MVFELWPLSIFPEGALASSVITCVWAGIGVTAFFNLRFGWTMSGIVVPGYLVPLLISKPWAAVAIYVEAVAAYLLIRLISEGLSRAGLWSSFFGRDRFLALILASVAARMVFDLWLIPEFGLYLASEWGLQLDYRNELHSFGLVVVALTANQLWKPGFLRGSACLAVTVGCTFLVVRYGLMEATNFSISNLKYLYEDVAGSIQAAPKAYIVLISTSFVASRLNLRYGWDFNGILVPSLLALQWYQPGVILTSFVEALLILLVSRALLRLDFFARFNIEGARKLVFFFNVGFIWKILLAHTMSIWAPDMDARDVYGYGYLLSTLMALKMHEREIAVRLTRATVQASLISILLATAIGLTLTNIPRFQVGSFVDSTHKRTKIIDSPDLSLADWLARDRVRLYRPAAGQSLPAPMPGETLAFRRGIVGVLTGNEEAIRVAAEDLAIANYQLIRTSDEVFYFREMEPLRGWGAYAIDPAAETDLLLETPLPVDEPASHLASAALFSALDARALAVAGSRRHVSGSPAADVLRSENTIFQAFHLQLAHENTVQIRAHRRSKSTAISKDPRPALYVTGRIPKELRLQRLDELLGGLEMHWDHLRGENRQRDARRGGYAELVLSAADVPSLRVRAQALGGATSSLAEIERVEMSFETWLLADKDHIARRASERYQPLRDEDLLYLDQEILSPLFDWSLDPTGYDSSISNPAVRHPLDVVAAAAAAIGYRIVLLDDPETGDRYAILVEANDSENRRSWGTHVFRIGPAAPYVFQVPRPLLDQGTLESALALFDRFKGRALLSAGAHALSNADGSADLTSAANTRNLINLTTQVILRRSRLEPVFVAQISGISLHYDDSAPDADVLIAIAGKGVGRPATSLLARRLFDVLAADDLKLRMVEGEKETVGYEVGSRAPYLYSNLWPYQDFAILWMSREERTTGAEN